MWRANIKFLSSRTPRSNTLDKNRHHQPDNENESDQLWWQSLVITLASWYLCDFIYLFIYSFSLTGGDFLFYFLINLNWFYLFFDESLTVGYFLFDDDFVSDANCCEFFICDICFAYYLFRLKPSLPDWNADCISKTINKLLLTNLSQVMNYFHHTPSMLF